MYYVFYTWSPDFFMREINNNEDYSEYFDRTIYYGMYTKKNCFTHRFLLKIIREYYLVVFQCTCYTYGYV